MVSEPDTVVRNVLDSQQSGATAVVTAEAHVPMIAATLSTSMSLRAARTAASGLVWSSSAESWTWRPMMPPAALTSPTTHSMALRIGGPYEAPAAGGGLGGAGGAGEGIERAEADRPTLGAGRGGQRGDDGERARAPEERAARDMTWCWRHFRSSCGLSRGGERLESVGKRTQAHTPAIIWADQRGTQGGRRSGRVPWGRRRRGDQRP